MFVSRIHEILFPKIGNGRKDKNEDRLLLV